MGTNERLVNQAKDHQILGEYQLILNKKSVLPRRLRDKVTARALKILDKQKSNQ